MDTRQLQKQWELFVRAPKYSDNGATELYCVCRRGDNGDLMVACDGCDEWFHFKCMKLDLRWKDLVKSYKCPFCEGLKGLGRPLWKRKCRLGECYRPIEEGSAFCCKDHGNRFWQGVLDRFQAPTAIDYDGRERVFPGELNTLVNTLASRDQLLEMGASLPEPPNNLAANDNPLLEVYGRKISALEASNKEVSERREVLEKKRAYIMLLRDRVIEINAILNRSAADGASDGSNGAGPKKKKLRGKTASKFDICGYHAQLEVLDWNAFVKSEGYAAFMGLTLDEETVRQGYAALISEEANAGQPPAALESLCLNDRRKCIHSNWFTIERDDVNTKLDIATTTMEAADGDIADLKRLISVQKWELSTHS